MQKKRVWIGYPIWMDPERYPEYQKSKYTTFDKETKDKYCVARFERKFQIKDDIESVKIYSTGCTKYRLYIDQDWIGKGPAISGGDYENKRPPKEWYYDEFSLEMEKGSHILVAEVCLLPEVMAEYSVGQGVFLLDMEVTYQNGEKEIIGTDESWLCGVDERYFASRCYNANKSCHLFPSKAVKPKWNLYCKQIPNLVYEEVRSLQILNPFYEERVRLEGEKIKITKGSPVSFWIKYDKIYSSFVKVKASGNKGTKITLHLQEILGRTNRTEEVTLGENGVDYQGFMLQSVQYINVVTAACWEDVELDLSLLFVTYPQNDKSYFRCSNESLNKIYEVGKWTLGICRQDYHLDSPIHQETLGCTGDYMIESLINYYTFGDAKLTRFDIIRTRNWLEQNEYRMFHTSYSLMWVQMIWDYYMHTGDKTILSECKGTVKGLLNLFVSYMGDSGLLEEAPNYMFMDWVQDGEFNLHHPPKVRGIGYLSVLFIHALEQSKSIWTELEEDTEFQLWCCQIQDKVKEGISLLWDEKRQLYMDGINLGSQKTNKRMPYGEGTYYSQHMNTLAVLYDIAPQEKQQAIMLKVMDDDTLTQAQPYFYHFIFEALDKTDLFERYGVERMLRWKSLLDETEGGLKEVWYGFDCDYSHAWSATPVYQMPSKILGIKPIKPGFKEFMCSPILGQLEWAEGRISTPDGEIEVVCREGQVHISHPDTLKLVKMK